MWKKIRLLPLIFLVNSPSSLAGYQAIGEIKAQDCIDMGIKVCSVHRVTEVRNDGIKYEIADYYEEVSTYDKSKGMCWIYTKSQGLGALSFGLNATRSYEFWGYDKKGKFGKIDPDYLYFKCLKR